MSQKTVHVIIGRLLTDEEFRSAFLLDPSSVLLVLREQGHELTALEVEALLRTERTLWKEAAERVDPLLQRCSLHDEEPGKTTS